MRPWLIAGLAWQDYRNDARLSACSVLALVAVIAPLLVLFGLKFGLVGSLTERLQRDPSVREIIPLGGAVSAPISSMPWGSDRTSPSPSRGPGRSPPLQSCCCLPKGRAVTVEMLPTAAGDPLLQQVPPPQGLQQVVLSFTAAEARCRCR